MTASEATTASTAPQPKQAKRSGAKVNGERRTLKDVYASGPEEPIKRLRRAPAVVAAYPGGGDSLDAAARLPPARMPWAGAAPPLRKGLAAGSPVTLTGIASKPALNGRDGWSLGLCPSTERCVVQLEPRLGQRRMPEPIAVRPECIADGEDFPADLSGVAEYISDAQIAAEMAGSNCEGRRSVERAKRAIGAAHTVLNYSYYGHHGIYSLEYGVAKRMQYLLDVFHNNTKLKWWVRNMVAGGSPDFMCEYTGAEVHFYCLNARQMAAFVRTGYDPSYGFLPQQLHSTLVLDEY